jgi:hypothetical protein
MWKSEEKPARGREGGGQGAGGHVARLKAAWGRPVRGTWLARAAGRRAERKQSRGAAGARHMAGEGGGASGREETEQRGWR